MTRLEREMLKALDATEEDLLLKWDKWLTDVFDNIPKIAKPEQISLYVPPNAGQLGALLKAQAHIVFTMGQAHGEVEIQKIIEKHERKLADFGTENNPQDFWVVPRDALSALEARSLTLAGDVESQVINQVKQILMQGLIGMPRAEMEAFIQEKLKADRNRASLIVTTETTYAYNRGRINSFQQSPHVDYVRFSAIMDKRTSEQCRTRHGLIMALDDPQLEYNTPPLHGHCRSILSPVLSRYQRIDESKLNWDKAAPLPKGWKVA